MPEWEPQTPEKVNIHERGGLTPAHWTEIFNLLSKNYRNLRSKDQKLAKDIFGYAKSVVAGKIIDKDFQNRNSLDARHWSMVESEFCLESPFMARSLRQHVLLERSDGPVLKLHQEIYLFAICESLHSVNFDALINKITNHCKDNFITIDLPSEKQGDVGYSLRWSNDDQAWHRIKYELTRHTYGASSETTDLGEVSEEYDKSIHDHWLLTPNEVSNPIHTSPQNLVVSLRELAESNRVEFIRRLTANQRLNPWDDRDNALMLRTGDIPKNNWILYLFKSSGLDIWNPEMVVEEQKRIYRSHYGITPYILSGNVRLSGIITEASRIFLLAATREKAKSLVEHAAYPNELSIFVEGDIESTAQLPPLKITGLS